MPYRFLDDIALADVAVEITSSSLENLFSEAAEALLQIQIENTKDLRQTIKKGIQVSHAKVDMLLYRFLQELIFLKDAKRLLLLVDRIRFRKQKRGYVVNAQLKGELIDPQRHEQRVDVKAVTLHRFEVVETAAGWKATIIFDI